MFKEFAGDVFVGLVFFGKFQGHGKHVEAEHAHPTGAVGLLEMTARGQRRGTIKDSDVVETEKAAFERYCARRDLCD